MAIELNRIGWEDAPSEQTPIDSGNLKQMEQNTEDGINELGSQLIKRPLIKILTNRQKLTTTGSFGSITIPLGDIELNIDNVEEFSKNENKIIIGNNVNLIRLIAYNRGIGVPFSSQGAEREFVVQKNNKDLQGVGFYIPAIGGYVGSSISTILSVQPNDEFNLKLVEAAAGESEILEGWMIIEKLK